MKHIVLLITIFLNANNFVAQEKIIFNIKKSGDLPTWIDSSTRTYTLNDDRIVEPENIEYIGAYHEQKGEVFFIDGKEIIFSEEQTIVSQKGSVMTKTLKSGDYEVIIKWDSAFTTGAYSDGYISLKYKNQLQGNSTAIYISGW